MCNSPLLDTSGAASYLGITERQFVKNWRAWQIPVIKLGHRTLRYRPEDLATWAGKRARRPVA